MHPISARFNRSFFDHSKQINQLEFTVTCDDNSSKDLIIHANPQRVVSVRLYDNDSQRGGEVDADSWMLLYSAWRENDARDNEFNLRVNEQGEIIGCTLRESHVEEDSEPSFDMSRKVHCQRVHGFYGTFFTDVLPKVALYPYSFLNAENKTGTTSPLTKEESSNLALRNILLAIPLTIPAVITMLCAAALAALAIVAAPFIYGGALLADSVCSDKREFMMV